LVLPAILIGGLVGLLVRSFPDVTGGGEELVMRLVQNRQILAALITLLVVRMGLFYLSYGVGTPGGLFFPIVALGAISGVSFARTVEQFFPSLVLNPGKCAVAGMAALLGATIRAPLTGLMLIIEMTGSYQLVVMSLLASIIADGCAEFLGGRPIYEQLLDLAQGSNKVTPGS
jgi:CIC family chloride channel protein